MHTSCAFLVIVDIILQSQIGKSSYSYIFQAPVSVAAIFMLREAYEEACKVRTALLAVLSARDVTNVESDISIRKDAGPEANSLALGNVGLIDVKEARVDGEAQKCIEAQAGGIAEAVGDVHGDCEGVVAKPAMVTKKDNRAHKLCEEKTLNAPKRSKT